MNILNKRGYNPVDDSSNTGFRRPPRDTACICDYFASLMELEDGGKFLHDEMNVMLDDPDGFFAEEPKFCPYCGNKDIVVDIVDEGWSARSNNKQDRENTATLREHQCRTCEGRSFWT